jgi:hypothetical protein
MNQYRCNICDKSYSSRQSLWNHNNKFHLNIVPESAKSPSESAKTSSESAKTPPESTKNTSENNNIICEYCKTTFTRNDSLKKHFTRCKIKLNSDNKLKEENDKLKIEMELFKTEMAAMKKQLLSIMNKQCKIHPKTLQKINNNLNNSCNTTNNIINIVQLGNENLENVFSKNKQIEILKQRYGCLPYLIREAHLNDKYPQFKNILITNLQNNIAYKYDKTTKNFIAVDKSELLNEVVGARMEDIESFFESNTDVLDEKTKDCVEKFISKMESREGTYYDDKMKDVKLMIYNNRDKVSKELIQTLEIII